jgi:hypothetical protein
MYVQSTLMSFCFVLFASSETLILECEAWVWFECSDMLGVCTACGERVVGEGSGCTAMDQVYHISCFTCQHCAIQLQGKPFYALEGKPYCEEDYLVSALIAVGEAPRV